MKKPPIFRLIVAGGRNFNDYSIVEYTLDCLIYAEYDDKRVEIVSGMAKGADKLGVRFAESNDIPLHKFPADWKRFPRMAGFIRNEQMGNFADALVAFWDGESNGTRHMIEYMKKLKKIVHIVSYIKKEKK